MRGIRPGRNLPERSTAKKPIPNYHRLGRPVQLKTVDASKKRTIGSPE
jgi:hypothetical protein